MGFGHSVKFKTPGLGAPRQLQPAPAGGSSLSSPGRLPTFSGNLKNQRTLHFCYSEVQGCRQTAGKILLLMAAKYIQRLALVWWVLACLFGY